MIIMLIQSILSTKSKAVSTIEFCTQNNLTYISANQPYNNQYVSQLNSFYADLMILVGGFGIVREPLLSICPRGILSYHHGNMRQYRGMPPYFWELYNNEKFAGVTVQLLDKGLDSGIPIAEIEEPIKKANSFKTLKTRMHDKSTMLLYEAVKIIQSDNNNHKKLDTYGKVYTLPNLRQWLLLQFRLLIRKIS